MPYTAMIAALLAREEANSSNVLLLHQAVEILRIEDPNIPPLSPPRLASEVGETPSADSKPMIEPLKAILEQLKERAREDLARRNEAEIAFDNALINLAVDLAKIINIKSEHTAKLKEHILTIIECAKCHKGTPEEFTIILSLAHRRLTDPTLTIVEYEKQARSIAEKHLPLMNTLCYALLALSSALVIASILCPLVIPALAATVSLTAVTATLAATGSFGILSGGGMLFFSRHLARTNPITNEMLALSKARDGCQEEITSLSAPSVN